MPSARFTLIELLVVVAIIGVLVSMLLPGLQKAKKTAMQIKCAGQQHQLLIATLVYASDFDGSLPNRTGSGVRFDLCSADSGNIRHLLYQTYLRDVRHFRCPSLVGNGAWNTDAQGYFNAGYLGYQFIGYSSVIHHQDTNAYTHLYWINVERIPTPSDYMMVSCNIIDDVAALGYHNFMEMNWTAHDRDFPAGSNIASLDGSVAWTRYSHAPAYTLNGPTFTGPYWETMIPMRGLILRDFSCVPDSSPATAFFWTAGHVHSNGSSQPLRGRLTLR